MTARRVSLTIRITEHFRDAVALLAMKRGTSVAELTRTVLRREVMNDSDVSRSYLDALADDNKGQKEDES